MAKTSKTSSKKHKPSSDNDNAQHKLTEHQTRKKIEDILEQRKFEQQFEF